MTQRRRSRHTTALSGVALTLALTACGLSVPAETIHLRFTHQWPSATTEEGDFRAVIAERFSEEVFERTDGDVQIEIFAGSSLIKTNEQYEALRHGSTDMALFPLDYASGVVPEFSITGMPTLIRNHEEARAWRDAEIGDHLSEVAEDNGLKLLTWTWSAGAIGVTGDSVVTPDDIDPGMTLRAASVPTEDVFHDAGAGVTTLPSDEIYTAMQTGVLDAAVTSTSSFVAFNLEEQVNSWTSPSENALWFLFQPVMIGTHSWERLSPEHQEVIEEVGQEMHAYADEQAVLDDVTAEEAYEEAGIEVLQMDDEAFAEWEALTDEGALADFAEDVPDGELLIELAQRVQDAQEDGDQ